MKNKIIILSVFLILLASFFAPQVLFEMEDLRTEKQIFTQSKTKRSIDVQAEKIYLVNAIHEMCQETLGIQYQISRERIAVAEAKTPDFNQENENAINPIKSELLKLQNCKVLQNMDFSMENTKILAEIYTDLKNEYKIQYIFLENGSEQINIGIESKTGKILFAVFPKDKLVTDFGSQEILENYVKYLDLYIIGDWKFENNRLNSEKAQLYATLFLDSNTNMCFLSIQSIKKDTKYYEIVESTK